LAAAPAVGSLTARPNHPSQPRVPISVRCALARFRSLLVASAAACAGGGAVTSPAAADEWPTERQFVLVEPPALVHTTPPPASVAETADGALLVLVYWPFVETTAYGETEWSHTSLVRIAPDGSRAFVPPFGEPERGHPADQVDDEILPLGDMSILITRENAIDRLRPDGSIERFAGTSRYGESSSGDGGPATAADIGEPQGLSRFPDGSIVFAEGQRIRRVAADGTITTIAGNGEYGTDGDDGDGGPATAARLASAQDVLPTRDGGFLIADTFNGRVRRVGANGAISTIAGVTDPDRFSHADAYPSSGDGGPATAAHLSLPAHLARLPDGSLLIGERDAIRRVAPDGTINTIFHAQQSYRGRLGDFAGRYGERIEAMDVTREGGIAVITSGVHLRALYLAPPSTTRTLVALHGARVSGRRVKMTVDATTRGLLRLEVRRRGVLVAHATRRVRAGRRTIGVGGRFMAVEHEVSVTLSADRGGTYSDSIDLLTGDSLPKQLVAGGLNTRCKRIDKRRVDCEIHDEESEESGVPCLYTFAYRLFRSGLTFSRPYGPQCHSKPMRFDRTPDWNGPWRASPQR
jgi:hypothetical protein